MAGLSCFTSTLYAWLMLFLHNRFVVFRAILGFCMEGYRPFIGHDVAKLSCIAILLGAVDNSTNEPLSRYASNACPSGTGTARVATSIACAARERGWGEGSNQLKNRNFGSSMIAHPLPGFP